MIGEFEVGGVFIPIALATGVVGFLLSLLVRRVLRAAGAYRLIWHAGLFDVAMFVLLWAIIDYCSGTFQLSGMQG
jgi:protein AaeX